MNMMMTPRFKKQGINGSTDTAFRLCRSSVSASSFVFLFSLFYFLFSFLSSLVFSQVLVQSDVFVESEVVLENLQNEQGVESAVIETQLVLKENAAFAEEPDFGDEEPDDVFEPEVSSPRELLSGEEIARINESLRRAIQQSRRLNEEKERLDQELRSLRGTQRLERRRFESMEMQVRDYQERLDSSVRMKEEFDRAVADLQGKIERREQALMARIEELRTELETQRTAAGEALRPELAQEIVLEDISKELETVLERSRLETAQAGRPETPPPGVSPQPEETPVTARPGRPVRRGPGVQREARAPVQEQVSEDARRTGTDVINLLSDLDEMRRDIRDDEARIYYNMGNIFFHQGKYAQAAAEYRKALEISPADPNAHFNLAFISSEFLRDYRAALEHYQQYLFLNPAAEDAALVHEKLLEIQMIVTTYLNDGREQELRKHKEKKLYNW